VGLSSKKFRYAGGDHLSWKKKENVTFSRDSRLGKRRSTPKLEKKIKSYASGRNREGAASMMSASPSQKIRKRNGKKEKKNKVFPLFEWQLTPENWSFGEKEKYPSLRGYIISKR